MVLNSSPKVRLKAQKKADKAEEDVRAAAVKFKRAAATVMRLDGKRKPAAQKKRVQKAEATTPKEDTEDVMMADVGGKESEVDVSQKQVYTA